jgi:predicted O-methyltransferase YrrM
MLGFLRKPNVNDLWHTKFLGEFLRVINPSVTVEIGIALGDTTRVFSRFSNEVFAIDIDESAATRVSKLRNVKAMIGDSSALMRGLLDQGVRADFVFIDGDHRIEKVMSDFEVATALMNPNGIIGIHDTYPRNQSFISTENEWCGNSYLAPSYIQERFPDWSTITIPVHPGLTLAQRLEMTPFI